MTLLESQTKEIAGVVYRTAKFPARKGYKLFYELKNALGPAIGAWMSEQAENILTLIGGTLTQEQFLNLTQRLLEFTFVEGSNENLGKDTIFDEHFAGRYGALMKVLAFVVEVNYSDFLTELIPPQMIDFGKQMLKEVMDQSLKSTFLNVSVPTGQSIDSH